MTKYFLLLTLFFFSVASQAQEIGCNKDYSSLVISERTGEILFEKRSDKFSYPASLVKMMTLYLTFEALERGKLNLEKNLVVSDYGAEIARVNNGNSLHLKEGDKITVLEAVEAVIVKSFNEAAVTLAEGVAGDEWSFVRKMNQKAVELGMNNTSFRNASGLHAEGQYTNSYDLARLALALKKNFPQYYHFFALKKFSYRGQKYTSHNHVLLEYKGAEGMKTGFTNASGFNLVSAAKKDDERIISIVLGCPTFKSRDKLTKQLLDICFKKLNSENRENPFAKINVKGFDYCEKGEAEGIKKDDEPRQIEASVQDSKDMYALNQEQKFEPELKAELEKTPENKKENKKEVLQKKTSNKKFRTEKIKKEKSPQHKKTTKKVVKKTLKKKSKTARKKN